MELGLPYLHPYLDSIGPNFRGGANFATGGSTIRPQNKSFTHGGASPFSLDFQFYQFTGLKQRSNESINEGTSTTQGMVSTIRIVDRFSNTSVHHHI